MRKNLKKAFTLVEMLIVVIIIGILIAALLPKLTGAQAKARDVARQTALSQIATALTMYFNDNGEYPKATSTGYCAALTGENNGAFPSDFSNYMPEIPKDPQTDRVHKGTGGCTGYFAYAGIENAGAEAAAALLIANTENVGKSTNYILSGDYFTGSDLSDVTGTDVTNAIKWIYPDGTGDANTDDDKSVYVLFVY